MKVGPYDILQTITKNINKIRHMNALKTLLQIYMKLLGKIIQRSHEQADLGF